MTVVIWVIFLVFYFIPLLCVWFSDSNMLNLLLWMQCDLKNWVSRHFQHCSYCSELLLAICSPPCFHIIVSFGSVNNVGQTLKIFVRDEKDKDREEEEKVGVHEVCFFRKCDPLSLKRIPNSCHHILSLEWGYEVIEGTRWNSKYPLYHWL